jgi:phosphoribosylformylglycinamidine synthase
MHFGIIVFPGTNCDRDCLHVVSDVLGHSGRLVWHEEDDVSSFDALLLPGGFAYGDYLRTGAIARFSPVMGAVAEFAALGKPVVGICNGFQILCEAGLLPGVLRRNRHGHFVCDTKATVRVEHNENRLLNRAHIGDVLTIPIRHGEGSYFCDELTLRGLESNRQILLRYCSPSGAVEDRWNPNGSVGQIAGVMNREGNVFGLMPHPEAASEKLLGSDDGALLFRSIVEPVAPGRARSRDSGLLNVSDR